MTPLPPTPPAEHWIALGVRHAILARTMPAVRHDLAGPLSILRMGATVLQRRLAEGALPPAQAAERVQQWEAHLRTLADGTALLRLWDLPAHGAPQPLEGTAHLAGQATAQLALEATAHLALRLAQPLLALRGTALEPSSPEAGAATTPQSALLCLLLGGLYLLAEAPAGAPARIRLTPLEGSAHGLRLQASGHAGDDWPAPPATGAPPLDAQALACLARQAGAGLRCGPDWVEIDAPAVSAAPAASSAPAAAA